MVRKHQKVESDMASTYGSRFITEPIPKFRLPEKSMPGKVAYQLIHDELNLDGRPALNLASFVTTWMEPEADQLIHESMKTNMADEDEYPHVMKIQERCVNMIADLFHAERGEGETAVGTACIGSSEAIMLAGLAMKWNWRKRRQDKGLSTDKPNLIMGENVQVCWEKFTRYFDVEPRLIPVEHGRWVISAEEVAKRVDENTIGACAILGSTFTGEYEPIEEVHDALVKLNAENGWDVPLHVDGASGGFVAPFLQPDLKWDFRLPLVRSINVSGHKYGMVYPGSGWVIWRDHSALPEDLIFHVNYLGGDMPTFNLNFSRPASHVVAQYYNFLRLGREGYGQIMKNLKTVGDYISSKLAAHEDFEMLSDNHSLPIAVWQLKKDVPYTVFQLSDKIRQYGWIIPAYTMPKNAEDVAVLRIVIRESMSREMADELIEDLGRTVASLRQDAPAATETPQGKSSKVC